MEIIFTKETRFQEKLNALINRAYLDWQTIEKEVSDILSQVRIKGDKALLEYTKKYDGCELNLDEIELSSDETGEALGLIEKEERDALMLAAQRIKKFHENQLPKSWLQWDEEGMLLGQKISPMERIVIYAPGGKACYPSTVLMCAIPAKIAGVKEICLTSPPRISPYILAAASIVGIDRVFQIGGAQAIAAFAYGTETVPKVDKIVGPGNIYVTMAKKMVFGQVGIDMLAGPSEILIISHEKANPSHLATDLLSQAEHDELALPILITPSKSFAEKVREEVYKQLEDLPRKEIARSSLEQRGVIIITESLAEAIEIANGISPEHLELALEEPFQWLGKIKNAGAIFLGSYTPEALGDYIAGPNHVIPTGGAASFSSPLGVEDFIKRSNILFSNKEALNALTPSIEKLASMEGLEGHAMAVKVRGQGSAKSYIKKEISELQPYTPEDGSYRIKLDANESPYSLPEDRLKELFPILFRVPLNRYPDPEAKVLRKVLAEHLSLKEEMILLGNGSDELIQLILLTFGNMDSSCLIPFPAFIMYEILSKISGKKVSAISLGEDFDLDIEKMLDICKEKKPFLIFLGYPNNPTGNCFSREKIFQLLEQSSALVVVDEAYYDFSGETFLPEINKYNNLIIIRSFSKVGFAGLRLGYLISGEDIVRELNKVRLPYNVNRFSQEIGYWVLKDKSILEDQISELIQERERIYKELKNIEGITPYPSRANFILFRTEKDCHIIHKALKEKGILVRNLRGEGILRNCLRVTLGTPEENKEFLNALREAVL